MTADAAGDRREVVVVGGGQAGLAIGYLLAQQGRQFTILEAADTPAAAWRARWDSLKLFTPGPLRQPARAARSPATRTPTRAATTSSPTSPTTRATSSCRSSSTAASAPSARGDARLPRRARRPQLRGRPGRHRHRTVPGPARAARRRRAWTRASCSSTAARTAGPSDVPGGPGARGRRRQHRLSDRRGARAHPRGAPVDRRRGRRRCRSGSSAATCSAISKRPA